MTHHHQFTPRREALRHLGIMAVGGAATALLLSACSEAVSAPDPLRVSLEEGRQLFESK